jgi:serine/threonine protein kinase
MQNVTILGKYDLLSEIGKGKFGLVFKGVRKKDQEFVAIKIESAENAHKILKHEAFMIHYLQSRGCKKIPTVYWYGVYLDKPTMVMTYYQNSLEDYIRNKCLDQSKLDTIMSLLLRILESVHSNYVIHRDIKPANIMMKMGELYLIDFGFATYYVDQDFQHVEYKDGKEHVLGTPKYMSYYIHNGVEPYRRDDLISLGYLYLEMAAFPEKLPWELTWITSEETSGKTSEETSGKTSRKLCVGKNDGSLTKSEINQERRKDKSWENMKRYIEYLGKTGKTETGNILAFMEICYEMPYYETIDYDEWIKLFVV